MDASTRMSKHKQKQLNNTESTVHHNHVNNNKDYDTLPHLFGKIQIIFEKQSL